MSRTLVIGDVHGASLALEQVLDRSSFTIDDTLICLGDVCDGWSGVCDALDILMSLPKLIFIRGNHDQATVEWMNTAHEPVGWLSHGGQATQDALIRAGRISFEKYAEFLNKSMMWYEHDHKLFIHAGLGWMATHPAQNAPDVLMRDVNMWNRAMRYPAQQLGHWSEIYIGHIYLFDKPTKCANVWNMDTGSGFCGRLSIMDISSKEVWQSDIVKELYPLELGRDS